jgi:hypothetical protein
MTKSPITQHDCINWSEGKLIASESRGRAAVEDADNRSGGGFPEDIVSTHWVPKELRLDDKRTLVFDPS